MKTTVILVIDHKRPIPDLLKLVEGRVYNLDAVEDCNASVAETPAEASDSTYSYAVSLARAIFNSEYASDPDYASGKIKWDVFDTTAGVLTQIDNMVSGMKRTTPQPPAVPLTDAQCDEFRRHPGSFNDMVRVIYESGKEGRA